MIDITRLKVGDKVRDVSFRGEENGIVKEIRPERKDVVLVVYHCAGEWENFMDYTGASTKISDLKMGWE